MPDVIEATLQVPTALAGEMEPSVAEIPNGHPSVDEASVSLDGIANCPYFATRFDQNPDAAKEEAKQMLAQRAEQQHQREAGASASELRAQRNAVILERRRQRQAPADVVPQPASAPEAAVMDDNSAQPGDIPKPLIVEPSLTPLEMITIEKPDVAEPPFAELDMNMSANLDEVAPAQVETPVSSPELSVAERAVTESMTVPDVQPRDEVVANAKPFADVVTQQEQPVIAFAYNALDVEQTKERHDVVVTDEPMLMPTPLSKLVKTGRNEDSFVLSEELAAPVLLEPMAEFTERADEADGDDLTPEDVTMPVLIYEELMPPAPEAFISAYAQLLSKISETGQNSIETQHQSNIDLDKSETLTSEAEVLPQPPTAVRTLAEVLEIVDEDTQQQIAPRLQIIHEVIKQMHDVANPDDIEQAKINIREQLEEIFVLVDLDVPEFDIELIAKLLLKSPQPDDLTTSEDDTAKPFDNGMRERKVQSTHTAWQLLSDVRINIRRALGSFALLA